MESLECKENPNCAGCLNDIGNDEYVSALHQDWHKDCFRCSVCDCQLSTWYMEKAGMLFCQQDYWERFGDACHHCTQVITGPVMTAGEQRFHPECFTCARCEAHIEDEQPYALLQRRLLYCGPCAALVVPPDASRAQGHVVRSLRLSRQRAPTALTRGRCWSLCRKLSSFADGVLRAAIAFCVRLKCYRVDGACGLLALHLGDRILEINGTPVKDKPLDEIEKVLSRSDAVLQLTIEHNPEANIPNPSTPEAKPNIPEQHSCEKEDTEDTAGKRERLFKRKVDGGRGRVIKRKQAPPSPLLKDKEKSSSMSKLLDVVDGSCPLEAGGVMRDLSRARSFRACPAAAATVFRAADLIQGELLGSGFFGEVYKVTHRATGELMVLKQLYRVDELAQRNFLKEVAVLRSLQHPNVLRFIGVLYRDKRLHLITEYVCGGTLHNLLQDTSVDLSWSFRTRLARDVACGVGYLHRMNIIHRDLNSHNCLVREDKTVIVADFGLARIVERTASSTLDRRDTNSTLRRKRYTVVGNPYWMAPEMINGNRYDEKVDVFSFGIMLCEIIGRVSADPDFLPRRNDFGLNEQLFVDKFCRDARCPEPLYRVAFLACHLDPDRRPPFEVLEIWLETLVMHLSKSAPLPPSLLADVLQYGASTHAPSPECCRSPPDDCRAGHDDCRAAAGDCRSEDCGRIRRSPSKVASVELTEGVVKSQSNGTMLDPAPPATHGRALGKCVSASHICQSQRPIITITSLSRSHAALPNAPSGYILRADGRNLNITRVDDITQWLDPPPPLKRTGQLANIAQETKARKIEDELPAFLRNQSVEGLESKSKCEETAQLPFCRHFSIPDDCQDSDSSDSDVTEISDWYRNVSEFRKLDKMDVDPSKNVLAGMGKKGENLLGKMGYDVKEVRNPERLAERKIAEMNPTRRNIEHLKKDSPTKSVKNIDKSIESQNKPMEKTNFFTKNLLSPKLSRLFKPNTTEVLRNKQNDDENKEEKSKSKFFIQRPSSPGNICRSSYRVRPIDETSKEGDGKKSLKDTNVIKTDLKLASMGKPMTPIFRRNIPSQNSEFLDGRFSYRDKRYKCDGKTNLEPKYVEFGRHRIKTPVLPTAENRTKQAPLLRSSPNNNLPALAMVLEKDREKSQTPEAKDVKRRELGISRSNYVSLANLKINGRPKGLVKENETSRESLDDHSPVERVI